jgi:hypothetical protein
MPEGRPLPQWIAEIARAMEPLWISSTAALFVLWGYDLIPRVIRMLGHSGQTETIEWAVYMSLLVGYPVVCIIIALALPRIVKGTAATVLKAFVIAAAIACGVLYVADGRWVLAVIALLPAIATVALSFGVYRVVSERPVEGIAGLIVLAMVALIAWMSAGGLVYWTRATSWFLSSPVRAIAIVFATIIAITGLPRMGDSVERKPPPGVAFRIVSIFILLLLIVFSFRTYPMVEFYHWGFWVGPIEQLRQGGWLLKDTPSQYGFLSILIPAAMPGSAWVSFWYYQAAIYAIVTVMMFIIFRRLRGGVGNLLLSFFIVFTTLFFRPRSATLILPSQMTPSGGPVRFLWCFVLLSWLLLVFRDDLGRRKRRDEAANPESYKIAEIPIGAGFPLIGHVIWLCSVAWSFEAAIYSSAIWFSAFTVYLIQKAAAERRDEKTWSFVAVSVIKWIAVPVVMLLALYAIVYVIYMVGPGVPPDLEGYVEYGLLYSRGFGSLPIDTHGAVWYLLLVFFIASTAVVQFLVEDWRDFRLVLAAGVWGGIWSLSSYFVSRSHPVNLLSLAPVLLFAVAILLIVLRNSTRRQWHGYVRAASVPLMAIPIAMTLGHPGLKANLKAHQLSPAKFTEQVPAMDPQLEELMRSAGATPADPVVRIVDGRLMLPAWHLPDGRKVLSDKSWLPKPFEIIGSLPAPRRIVYIDRDGETPIGGWLVHHASDTVAHFDERMAEIERTHQPVKKFTRGPWTLWRMEPRRATKKLAP